MHTYTYVYYAMCIVHASTHPVCMYLLCVKVVCFCLCPQEAAKQGARVACLDFVQPTPQGTSWGE